MDALITFPGVMLTIVVIIALGIAGVKLFSRWVAKPIDLSLTSSGDRDLDAAERVVRQVETELDVAEDLGQPVSILNTLSVQAEAARTNRDIAWHNADRREATKKPAAVPATPIAIGTVRRAIKSRTPQGGSE